MISLSVRAVFVLLLVVTTWSITHGVDDEQDPTGTCRADGTCDSNDCVDKVPQCLFWAQKGECVNNPVYMAKSCPQSCELCIGNNLLFPWENDKDCEDSNPKCERWQREGVLQKMR
jgi:ShK domain-like